ncbi:putative 1,4 benzoquinone reductase [Pisolithus orientalis]|uniref:putative 1,4 benzoquinone reductase n=1 Tax=Pisolithus orientalis TaxID=936130 RepID=UPI0022242096|nr:putative 1,4 benzoquinone reductase [Pisolithus orientalis]KAI5997234.1 putative 1,4 benzoquinone reductase [Pisolithus orientalis]
MCFPSKKQKNNFADSDPTRSGTKAGEVKAAEEPKPSASTATPALPAPLAISDNLQNMSGQRVAIVIYSMYGHIAKVAEAVKGGINSTGGNATIYQIQETLSEDVLKLLKAPPRPDYPTLVPGDLVNFDAFLFGVPTRFGNFPAQWKAFWDATGGLWSKGALSGKMCSMFVSTGTQGGGQEVTVMNALSTFVHHGMIYVPLGYKNTFAQMSNLSEIHGGSPWGSGTFAGSDGSRQPSALELEIASLHGKSFWEIVSKHKFQ